MIAFSGRTAMRSDRALYTIWVRAVSIRNIDI